jgi:hypothetical protein
MFPTRGFSGCESGTALGLQVRWADWLSPLPVSEPPEPPAPPATPEALRLRVRRRPLVPGLRVFVHGLELWTDRPTVGPHCAVSPDPYARKGLGFRV